MRVVRRCSATVGVAIATVTRFPEFDDVKDMDQKFAALSEGGKVTMAPNDTFWGARFGMLVDAVGVNWMFNW